MNPIEWLDYEIRGNSLLALGGGITAAVVTWIALGVARRILQNRMSTLVETRNVRALRIAEHAVSQTRSWFLLLIAVVIGSRLLVLTPAASALFMTVIKIALLVQIGLWATAAMTESLRLRRERERAERPEAIAAMDMLGFVVRLVVWTLVLLMVLQNLGVNITALIAGLGVGGVAVALATQNILGDLFASLSIVLDKPFVVGDFLAVGDCVGSVERVGLKTTRVRSLSGEQLIFSNNDLLNSRIRNFGRMFERRVVFSIGVTYETPAEKLKRIPLIIREALEAQHKVRFDRAHFQKYGDYALIFEVVYYVLSSDYSLHMDIQQAVNLVLFERFADEGIQFAYPTQVVYLAGAGIEPAPVGQDQTRQN
jgi:small-conductance mechanosensitive channel